MAFLTYLRSLKLADNPICALDAVTARIFYLIPQLQQLDGTFLDEATRAELDLVDAQPISIPRGNTSTASTSGVAQSKSTPNAPGQMNLINKERRDFEDPFNLNVDSSLFDTRIDQLERELMRDYSAVFSRESALPDEVEKGSQIIRDRLNPIRPTVFASGRPVAHAGPPSQDGIKPDMDAELISPILVQGDGSMDKGNKTNGPATSSVSKLLDESSVLNTSSGPQLGRDSDGINPGIINKNPAFNYAEEQSRALYQLSLAEEDQVMISSVNIEKAPYEASADDVKGTHIFESLCHE